MEENRLQQCASCYLYYTTPRGVCQAPKQTFDKTRQICYNRFQGVLHKTVGGSNLPPEMEVSLVDILSVVIQLLHLILDAVKVTFDLSNKKR